MSKRSPNPGTRPSRATITRRRATAGLIALALTGAGHETVKHVSGDEGERPFTRTELVDLAIAGSPTVEVVAEAGDGERALIEKAAPGTLGVASTEIQEGLYRAIDKQFGKNVHQVQVGSTYQVPAVIVNPDTGSIDSPLLNGDQIQPTDGLHSR